MITRVKNNTTDVKIWGGQEFTPEYIYILQAVDYHGFMSDSVFFTDVATGDALIGSGDEFILDPIEAWDFLKHEGVTEIEIKSLPESQPFAIPTYRTKRDATTSITTIAKNSNSCLDFLISSERYVSGGCLIIENAEFGDYYTAEIVDIDGVIPEEYRASLCENYPIVASYINKEYISISTPGSIQAGAITNDIIDTYPLNAKITAGLYLRVTYYAIDSGLSRRAVINYYLTKKL